MLSALALVFVATVGLAMNGSAAPSHADEESQALETQIRESAEAYNNAVVRQQQLADEINKLDARIADLEAKLPAQRERSDESVRALYKYNSDTGSILMMMLESTSITDMLAVLDSYSWILEYNASEIRAAIQMEADLQQSRSQLASDKLGVDAAAEDARASLEAAKVARERAAERAAAAQMADQQKIQELIASGSGSAEEKAAASAAAQNAASSASSSNVGWSADKSAFVNQWAPRIDAYLSGSPMAGTGKFYAAAAWDNGVDPRWAPAISYVESGKGAACFASHNAWGYGGYSFSSWQEGINRVVASLGGSLYGGYLTREAASTYCPSNPDHWYNSCAEQMAQI